MSKRKLTIITILSLLILTGIYYTAANYGFFSGGTNAPSVPADTMTRGLVGYWEFDEGTGQTAYDASDSSNNGQLGSTTSSDDNDPSWTANGKNGGGMSFDGVDDYILKSDSASLSVEGDLTIESWIKFDSISIEQTVIGKWDETTATDDRSYRLWIDSSNNLNFSVSTDGSAVVSHTGTTTTFAADTWYYIVAIYDNAGTMDVYVNSILDATQKAAGVPVSIDDNISNLYIGTKENTSGDADTLFNGSIDSVRIYNRALSADEVRYHYNRGWPVGSWNFDEGSGLTTYDSTENNNDGTLKSSGLEFDGDNDYVSVGDHSSLDITGALTLELWMKSSSLIGNDGGLISKSSNAFKYFGAASNKVYELGILNNVLYFQIGNGTAENQLGGDITSLIDGTWHHIISTWDGTTNADSMKIYFDGVEIYQLTATISSIQIIDSVLDIGGYDTAYNFNGSIDEVRIYNTALSAAEIARQYNGDFSQDPTANLVMLQHFEEGLSCSANDPDPGSADCLTDDSGSGNHGTLHNFDNLSAWDTSPDGWVSDVKKESLRWTNGKYKTAGEFNGWDDYVDGGSASSLDTGTVLSVSAWFRLDAASDTGFIVSKMADSFLDGWALQHSGNDLHFYQNATFTSLFTTSNIITDTDWHYAAVVIDGSGNNAIYFDGSIVDTDNRTVDMDSTATLKIGANLGTYANYTDGFIDDVRIYNYARTAGEIRLDYNAGVATHLGPSGKTCSEDPAGCMNYGLVGSWGMDEGTGTMAYDGSDNSNDGSLEGGPVWTTDSSPLAGGGGSLKFDGVDDYVDLGSGSSLDITDGTITFFLKPENLTDNGNGIISKRNGNGVSNFDYTIRQAANDLQIQLGDGSAIQNWVSTSNFLHTDWQHIIVTFDGSNIILYSDGLEIQSAIQTVIPSGILKPLYVGSNYGTGEFFNGSIDNVRIYNRALSAEEVRYHYNKGGPVAEWKFDEGSGTTVYDSSGGGFHGTLTP